MLKRHSSGSNRTPPHALVLLLLVRFFRPAALVGAGVSQSSFFADLHFEKSWSKCKHALQPKDVTMDARMLSLSMSA